MHEESSEQNLNLPSRAWTIADSINIGFPHSWSISPNMSSGYDSLAVYSVILGTVTESLAKGSNGLYADNRQNSSSVLTVP